MNTKVELVYTALQLLNERMTQVFVNSLLRLPQSELKMNMIQIQHNYTRILKQALKLLPQLVSMIIGGVCYVKC